jgi:hypothetical protein
MTGYANSAVSLCAILFGVASGCNPSKEFEADCHALGGTFNKKSIPPCSLPLDETAVCNEIGGTYQSTGTPRCTLPSKTLNCTSVSSASVSFDCKDAGNFDSTCATAACPAGFVLTGGGGICAAGDRKLKGLSPNFPMGKLTIQCEKQGVPPQVTAICCKL